VKINSSTQNVENPTYDQQQNIEPLKRATNPESGSVFSIVKNDKQEKEGLSKVDVHKAVEKLNQTAQAFNKRFHFSIHEGTHRVMVQVIDTTTGKVINEIPPEKVLDIVASMNELLGLMIDKRI